MTLHTKCSVTYYSEVRVCAVKVVKFARSRHVTQLAVAGSSNFGKGSQTWVSGNGNPKTETGNGRHPLIEYREDHENGVDISASETSFITSLVKMKLLL